MATQRATARFTAGYLIGRWRLKRRIIDLAARGRRAPARALFLGKARFARREDGAIQHVETGALHIRDAAFPAARRYLWRLDAPGAENAAAALCYEDGRPLAVFRLGALEATPRRRATARHDCAPDVYQGALRVLGPDLWRLSWRVAGPRKDFMMSGVFQRL